MPRRKFDLSLLPPSPDLSFEAQLRAGGAARVAGIDEAGRGALAGPVCAAAAILPDHPGLPLELAGVRDSKQMTGIERDACRRKILASAAAYGVGYASPAEIDALGIVPATRLAIRRALRQIDPPPDHLLVDFLKLPQTPIPQTSLVKGDARSLSIAAASILAKTFRDDKMRLLAGQFPGYDWEQNKGYGTAAHIQALRTLGPSPLHRMSFAPLRPQE